jgi:hypothetical protein
VSSNGANAVYNNRTVRAVIDEVDSDFAWKRIVVRGYVFANGRPFYQREVPGQAYEWVDEE